MFCAVRARKAISITANITKDRIAMFSIPFFFSILASGMNLGYAGSFVLSFWDFLGGNIPGKELERVSYLKLF